MICESQKPVVDFLSAPENHDGGAVQRIDTHLSHVFLTADRAYKIKRAVRYDFVDFSSTRLRRAACEKEIDINRRTAPDIYLGVRPLYCKGGDVSWEGKTDPVEWAVEMARFDSDQQFDVLARRGKLDKALIKSLADRLARFHRSAEVQTSSGGGAGVDEILSEISTGLHNHGLGATRDADIAKWSALAFQELERHSALLKSRRRHGWVRRCHGDLHLANICLFKGEPTPFDAIEFNDDFAVIDVLYDLAFTSMDIIHHGRADLANLLINRYLSATRDYGGAGLLPLFQSMRAGVRAMVLSLPTQPAEKKPLAERLLNLAIEFLDTREEPKLFAVGGYSATGKSTLAGALAMQLSKPAGALILRSDVIRKRLLEKKPEDRLDESAYAASHSNAVYRQLLKDARRALRAGRSVVLDATFHEAAWRNAAAATAARLGAPFEGFWLTAPPTVLRDRIKERAGGASDANIDVLEKQLARSPEPEPGSWRLIDASGSPQQALHNALKYVEETVQNNL